MNIIEFQSPFKKSNIVFCIVDDINSYATAGIQETIKNLADFTLSNIYVKGYDVLVGYDEDELLIRAAASNYSHAVVMSPGTEFINGSMFFDRLESATKHDFFLMGHVLDRRDAYYELHHQCFVVNLFHYKNLNCPQVGKQTLGDCHTQIEPNRSLDNWHDDYTPKSITFGDHERNYNHKCHGWNILSCAFANQLPVLSFDEILRNNKMHHYPESKKDFDEKISWLYYRMNYCATEFVHTNNTEWSNFTTTEFDQVVVPASGTLYLDSINAGTVVFYDYNQKSLDYWAEHCPRKPNIEYKFVRSDLLVDDNLVEHINADAKNTLVNLSNIFCYEGTATVYPLSYRLNKENRLLTKLKQIISNGTVNFTMRAACGFAQVPVVGTISQLSETPISMLKKPTWHFNRDWI